MQQQQQGRRQLRGLGIAGEFLAEPQPQAAQAGAVLAGEQQACQPAQQQDQVDSQQAAQGPEHVHRLLGAAQGAEGQAGTADHRQNRERQQGQACALLPVQQGAVQAVTLGQPQGAVLDPGRQVAALVAGQAIGFLIFQRAGVFLAQAHGFGQPQALQGSQCSHASFHRSKVR